MNGGEKHERRTDRGLSKRLPAWICLLIGHQWIESEVQLPNSGPTNYFCVRCGHNMHFLPDEAPS